MGKYVKALSIFLGIVVICIGVISVYRFSFRQSMKQDVEMFTVEQFRNLIKNNDAFANNYNHKTIYLKGRCHSVRDKKKYYEVKLEPVKGALLLPTWSQTIPCKFSVEQKKDLEWLKKDKILVVQGNISIDKGLFNHVKL